MTRTLILVGLGGGLGSILRYLTSLLLTRYYPTTFPLGTLTVNFVGCFFIGLLVGLFERQQPLNQDLKFLLITGLCGGYTTFSAFTSESINLFQADNSILAFGYIGGSIVSGLLATWFGLTLTRP